MYRLSREVAGRDWSSIEKDTAGIKMNKTGSFVYALCFFNLKNAH